MKRNTYFILLMAILAVVPIVCLIFMSYIKKMDKLSQNVDLCLTLENAPDFCLIPWIFMGTIIFFVASFVIFGLLGLFRIIRIRAY